MAPVDWSEAPSAWHHARMPDPTTPITLRTPTRETFRQFLTPAMTAFGEVWTEGEIENETELVEMDRMVGAFEGDLAVGVSGAISFRMTTPGGEVGAAGDHPGRRAADAPPPRDPPPDDDRAVPPGDRAR